jgi:peptidoglycan/xylan/chitin deacetylase (PgdA/CDA1 family)
MYHAFSNGRAAHDPYHLHVDVAAFEDQLQRLRAAGWAALDLDGYLAWRPGDRPGFLVTIDDGFQSALDLALPVLTRLHVPSLMLLPAGLLGGTSRWLEEQPDAPIMSADSVRDLASARMEVGGHGWDHQDMTKLSREELVQHTTDVREQLHGLSGRPPRAFAYPFGWHDADARSQVSAAGYELAFAVYDDCGPFAISRSDVKPDDTWATLRWKLLPGYRRLWRAAGAARPLRAGLRRLTQRS